VAVIDMVPDAIAGPPTSWLSIRRPWRVLSTSADEEADVDEQKVWNGIASGAAVAAVVASKPLVERIWRLTFRSEPPGNPAHDDVQWRDALAWAVFTGAIVGVIRLLAQRGAVGAWRKRRGVQPPGLKYTRP